MTKKEAILAAAIEQFAAKGYNGASTAAIARQACVTEGLIFHHFKVKETIFITILETVMEDYLQTMARASADATDGLAAIEAMIRSHFRFSRCREREFRVLLRDFPSKLRTYDPPYNSIVGARLRRFLDILETGIAQGQEDGSIRALPVADTALILRAIFNGILHQNIPDDKPLPDLSQAVVNFCRHALMSSPSAETEAETLLEDRDHIG